MNGAGRVEWMEPNLGPIFSVPKEMKNTEFILGHFKNWHRLLGSRLRTLSKIRDSIIESKGGLGGLHIYLFYLYLYLFYIYICVCVYIYIYIFFFFPLRVETLVQPCFPQGLKERLMENWNSIKIC